MENNQQEKMWRYAYTTASDQGLILKNGRSVRITRGILLKEARQEYNCLASGLIVTATGCSGKANCKSYLF